MRELFECVKNLIYALIHGTEEDCRELGSKVGEALANVLSK